MPENQLPRNRAGAIAATITPLSSASPLLGGFLRLEGDLLLAGCKEGPNNFSYDARIGGRYNGAFTYYALKTLKVLSAGSTYAQWHQAICNYLPSASYPQSPQIFGDKAARKRRVFE